MRNGIGKKSVKNRRKVSSAFDTLRHRRLSTLLQFAIVLQIYSHRARRVQDRLSGDQPPSGPRLRRKRWPPKREPTRVPARGSLLRMTIIEKGIVVSDSKEIPRETGNFPIKPAAKI